MIAILDYLIKQARLTTDDTKYNSKTARDGFYQTHTWRKKRKEILERDNNECQVNKARGKVETGKLIVHHIKPLEYFPELAMDNFNLITVSHTVHNQIHELTSTKKKWEDEWW